jgi:secreted PhoX family phosphatase
MKAFARLTALGLATCSAVAAADPHFDLGQFRESQLQAHSRQLFGIIAPVRSASTASVDAAVAEAHPLSMLTLARGLRARVVSSQTDLGANIDMMALWPNADEPTHLIVCNEQGATNPGVQRVNIATGAVETILTGTTSCDPVKVTPWGTVVIAEENGSSGRMFEILDPLHTTGVTINNADNSTSDEAHVVYRPAVGKLSFEGVAIYPNGVMYYGDENRPSNGTAGGAYFKFIPSALWEGGAAIADLGDSPLADGQVYGLRLGKRSGNTDYGQGTNTGLGTWVMVNNSLGADLRAEAAALKLTGYYRPEDAEIDGKALTDGRVRFCANNTGNESADKSWGETICVTDGSVSEAGANSATPEVQYFVIGNKSFSMMDNIAYQPGRGNWVLHEDRDAVEMTGEGYPFNDSIWMCLEDGADSDTLSDGCVRIATLNDLHAESTGGLFDADGKRYFFSIQHNVTGHGTIVEVTGWR